MGPPRSRLRPHRHLPPTAAPASSARTPCPGVISPATCVPRRRNRLLLSTSGRCHGHGDGHGGGGGRRRPPQEIDTKTRQRGLPPRALARALALVSREWRLCVALLCLFRCVVALPGRGRVGVLLLLGQEGGGGAEEKARLPLAAETEVGWMGKVKPEDSVYCVARLTKTVGPNWAEPNNPLDQARGETDTHDAPDTEAAPLLPAFCLGP